MSNITKRFYKERAALNVLDKRAKMPKKYLRLQKGMY